jgi:hypothetical protein
MMNSHENLVLGVLLGAGLMYLLDPDRGRQRRDRVRGGVRHGTTSFGDVGDSIGARARRLRDRFTGAEAAAEAERDGKIEDSVLAARVRSRLGRMVTNPTGVMVSSEHGRVTLRGSIPDEEVRRLIDGVEGVPGVHDVINRLDRRTSPG